jgi:D-psicose/D-tagatose/L-ribulose 3-epimerase
MRELPFSVNSWLFGKMPIEDVAAIAKDAGLSGLEVSGEPDSIDIPKAQKALQRNGIAAFSISGNFLDEERAFCHSDPRYRAKAVEYGRKCVDMAVALGSKRVLIVPSQVNRAAYFASKGEDWKNAVASARELADYAKSRGGITIMIECVNKYEVNLVRTIGDGIAMAKDIGRDNVMLVGDTFHMQLEELCGVPGAIREAGKRYLAHLHMGDNTREVPGKGCIDWRAVFTALRDIQYEGAVSFEPIPRKLTLEQIIAGELDPKELMEDISVSMSYLKSVMRFID